MGRLKAFVNNHLSSVSLYKSFFYNPFRSALPILNTLRMLRKSERIIFPLNINLAITSKCNNKCFMCFEKGHLNKKSKELSLQEIKAFIDDIAPFRPLLFLTGGEPFMRKDIMEILDYICKRDIHFGICTNGTCLDKKMMDKISKMPIDSLIFSIHGIGKTHDKVTGIKGSYKKTMKNMEYLCKKKHMGMHIMVNSVVLPENVDELDELIVRCKEVGVDSVRMAHMMFLTKEESKNHSKDWCKDFKALPLKIHQYKNEKGHPEIPGKIKKLMKKNYGVELMFRPYLDGEDLDKWYSEDFGTNRSCKFFWTSTYIASTGDVYPCITFGAKLGNIKESSLNAIYNSEEMKRLREKIRNNLYPGCSRCCKL